MYACTQPICNAGQNEKAYRKASGVARPGPTRVCALPSTSLALPSPVQKKSRDSRRI